MSQKITLLVPWLAGFLALDAALFAALVFLPGLAPPALEDFFSGIRSSDTSRSSAFATASSSAGAALHARALAAAQSRVQSRLWDTLRPDDLPSLVKQLRVAGFPPALVRRIVVAQVAHNFRPRYQSLVDTLEAMPYWKFAESSERTAAAQKLRGLQSEEVASIRALLGDDYFATSARDPDAAQRRQYGNLPLGKIEAVERINADYEQMISQVRADQHGVILPEDRDKLALLDREKHADLAALLTPDELSDYELRSSPVLDRLRSTLTYMHADEAEFQAIYRIEAPYGDRLDTPEGVNNAPSGMWEDIYKANKEVYAQLKSTLSPDRYAAFVRADSYDFQQMVRLAEGAGLPESAAVQAYAARDAAADRSQQIFHDTSLSTDARIAAVKALAADTQNQIAAALGPAASQSYLSHADWLDALNQGNAIKFTAPNSTETWEISPPPPPRPAGKD